MDPHRRAHVPPAMPLMCIPPRPLRFKSMDLDHRTRRESAAATTTGPSPLDLARHHQLEARWIEFLGDHTLSATANHGVDVEELGDLERVGWRHVRRFRDRQ